MVIPRAAFGSRMTAQGIAARSDKTRSGLAVGKSPVLEEYAPITWPNTLSEIVSGGAILMLLVVWPWVL